MTVDLSVPTIDVRRRIPAGVIHELARQIAERFNPIKIILFGSYAYGKPKPESDLDMLIVMDCAVTEIQQALEIRQFINPLFGVDFVVIGPSRLKQRLELGDSFLREIVERGKILYESSDA